MSSARDMFAPDEPLHFGHAPFRRTSPHGSKRDMPFCEEPVDRAHDQRKRGRRQMDGRKDLE